MKYGSFSWEVRLMFVGWWWNSRMIIFTKSNVDLIYNFWWNDRFKKKWIFFNIVSWISRIFVKFWLNARESGTIFCNIMKRGIKKIRVEWSWLKNWTKFGKILDIDFLSIKYDIDYKIDSNFSIRYDLLRDKIINYPFNPLSWLYSMRSRRF